jgi:hypothetical protein
MLLLISDANILIDIEDGHLTPVVVRLPYAIAVPDILFELELSEVNDPFENFFGAPEHFDL